MKIDRKFPSTSHSTRATAWLGLARLDYRIKHGPAQCTDRASRYTGTARGTARRPNLSLVARQRPTSDTGIFLYRCNLT